MSRPDMLDTQSEVSVSFRIFIRLSDIRAFGNRSPTIDAFEDICRSLRTRINAALEEQLRSLSADCPDRLKAAIAHSLLADGKRLRPLMMLLANEACRGDLNQALPAACAVEMVHTYSLIHDDLPAMDDDDLRRGIPACHVAFDEATAILAGDGLLSWAFELMASRVQPPESAAVCCADLAAAVGICGMVGGQMADLAAEGRFIETDASCGVGGADPGSPTSNSAQEHLESIHRRKTSRLITVSAIIGARIAGADTETLAAVESYGKNVGLAFQIADDLLDTSGDSAKMGKQARKDAARGKLTYPRLIGLEASRQKARMHIDDACAAIAGFGQSAAGLRKLARFVVTRAH